eukprot:PITA_12388
MKNDVWDVVSRLMRKSVVTSKCLFKIKHGVDGNIEKYKARFVAKGFSQKEGKYYDDIFAPVARYTTIHLIFSLTASQGWTLHQMGVRTAFLHGMLQEEVYGEQPRGFEVEDQKKHVYRLNKAMYGLKQAPRAWYTHIDNYLMKLGLTRSNVDPNLYFKVVQECKSLPTPIEMNFKKLCGEVTGPDLANLSEYRQLIGALMFLVNTHLDICYVVNTWNQFMTEPLYAYWIAAKQILRYSHGTITLSLRYSIRDVRLHVYTDAN